MLSGKPILASYSGFPSMIDEANCGWFIEAENSDALAKKIIQISKFKKEELVQLGSNGRDWIKANRSYTFLANYLKDEIFTIQKKS